MHSKVSLDLVSCNLCGNAFNTSYYNDGEWYIVQCKNCKHTYTNPRPSQEALPTYYTETYFKDERHKERFYNEDGTPKVGSDKYENRIIDVESYCSSRGRVLEIGAARGAFLKVLRDRGWDVNGVEISSDAVKLAKEHSDIHLFCGTLEDFTASDKFDVICMYQTLEHVLDPSYICKRSFDLLNAGGKLIVEVPNIDCFELKWSKTRRKLSYDLPRHISHFSPTVLRTHLFKIGYKEVHVFHYPDRFVLSFFQLLQKMRSVFSFRKNTLVDSFDNAVAGNTKQLPMARMSNSILSRALAVCSRIIPGWRFTIIAIK